MKNNIKYYYSDSNFKTDLLNIINSLQKDNYLPKTILGIGRGGYVPATYLSHWFNVPLLTYHYSLRDEKGINNNLYLPENTQDILVVDDICDSGETLNFVDDLLSERNVSYKMATLVFNIAQDIFEPDYYGTEINKEENNCWVVFPWEQWWRQ